MYVRSCIHVEILSARPQLGPRVSDRTDSMAHMIPSCFNLECRCRHDASVA